MANLDTKTFGAWLRTMRKVPIGDGRVTRMMVGDPYYLQCMADSREAAQLYLKQQALAALPADMVDTVTTASGAVMSFDLVVEFHTYPQLVKQCLPISM